jgi:uncharacterized protein
MGRHHWVVQRCGAPGEWAGTTGLCKDAEGLRYATLDGGMTARAIFLLSMAVSLGADDASYVQQMTQWRAQREQSLKADDGWLTVAGLFWLSDGDNDIALPAHIGVFHFHDGKTTFRPAPGAAVTVNGKPATTGELKADTDKDGPDVVAVNALTMYVIHRGDKYGIRLKDRNSEYRRNFTGLHWYPVRPEYRITAKFVAYPEPKNIPIANVLGQTEPTPSPGYLVFTWNGAEVHLNPVQADKSLFIIFRDQTSGKTTYGAGRFLDTEMPKDGTVVLDFNQAYNPPCAFTPYATCPLPPPENRLPVAIEAGEMKYGDH